MCSVSFINDRDPVLVRGLSKIIEGFFHTQQSPSNDYESDKVYPNVGDPNVVSKLASNTKKYPLDITAYGCKVVVAGAPC